MSTVSRRWVAAALLLAGCTLEQSPLTPARSETAAIERVLTDWYAAMARHDSAAVADAMLPGFVIFEDTLAMDKSAILKEIVAGFDAGTQTASLTGFRTQVQGDVAWTSLRNNERWTAKDGTSGTAAFLETVIFRRTDGQWRMERYHATRIDRPAK
jgi:ketosteroid isomerase-like protein